MLAYVCEVLQLDFRACVLAYLHVLRYVNARRMVERNEREMVNKTREAAMCMSEE